jgi:hypothetical protein
MRHRWARCVVVAADFRTACATAPITAPLGAGCRYPTSRRRPVTSIRHDDALRPNRQSLERDAPTSSLRWSTAPHADHLRKGRAIPSIEVARHRQVCSDAAAGVGLGGHPTGRRSKHPCRFDRIRVPTVTCYHGAMDSWISAFAGVLGAFVGGGLVVLSERNRSSEERRAHLAVETREAAAKLLVGYRRASRALTLHARDVGSLRTPSIPPRLVVSGSLRSPLRVQLPAQRVHRVEMR